jgi:hypothetical protein
MFPQLALKSVEVDPKSWGRSRRWPPDPSPMEAVFRTEEKSMQYQPSTTVPSIAPDEPDFALERLFHPGRFFKRPADVLSDPALNVFEKRAILSSWASDACAVESRPALRRPPGADQPVSLDAIMDALRRLDHLEAERPASARHCFGQRGVSADNFV